MTIQHFVLAVAMLNFAAFAWSVIGVFRSHADSHQGHYRLLQLNSVVLWGVLAWALATTAAPAPILVVLAAIQTACLCLFCQHARLARRHRFTLAFSKDMPEQLISEGLYRYVRHPCYLVYLVAYFSIAIATVSLPGLALCASMLAIYRHAAVLEEEKFLSSRLRKLYRSYMAGTGRFLPRLGRITPRYG